MYTHKLRFCVLKKNAMNLKTNFLKSEKNILKRRVNDIPTKNFKNNKYNDNSSRKTGKAQVNK